jgi:hypothetical protein
MKYSLTFFVVIAASATLPSSQSFPNSQDEQLSSKENYLNMEEKEKTVVQSIQQAVTGDFTAVQDISKFSKSSNEPLISNFFLPNRWHSVLYNQYCKNVD